jgi:hypothetical protein
MKHQIYNRKKLRASAVSSSKKIRQKQIRRGAFVFAITIAAFSTKAAVYNFYFNNTEQGDGSTAQPSLNVNPTGSPTSTQAGGESGGVPAQAEATPTVPNAEAPAEGIVSQSVAPTDSKSFAAVGSSETQGQRKYKISLGAFYSGGQNWSEGYDYGHDGTNYRYKQFRGIDDTGGASFNMGYYPLSYLGFNLFAGVAIVDGDPSDSLAGLELEITPLKFNLFGFHDVIELAVMAGGTTAAAVSENIGSIFLGARVGFNFGQRWSLDARLRGNAGFIMADGGLGYRF